MKEITFKAQLWLPRPRGEVFQFFSSAHNLDAITPDWLKFQIVNPSPIQMQPGALIDYRLKVRGLPVRWRTEILEWNRPERFVDVQIRGPYKLWHHTHIFTEQDGGTLCEDVVRYWPRGGALVNWLFVRRDVERIFAFRQKRLREIFD
ncbi:MAG TPA: SRPBCC family protein [Methylomirabilota bacterium]|nr:SRPBCC family protein [Methylomirabilota bacterium]